jgi:hypothetical protein
MRNWTSSQSAWEHYLATHESDLWQEMRTKKQVVVCQPTRPTRGSHVSMRLNSKPINKFFGS